MNYPVPRIRSGAISDGLESSNARMATSPARRCTSASSHRDEIIARISEVEAAQVQTMAQRLFDPERIAVTLLGRLDKSSWSARG